MNDPKQNGVAMPLVLILLVVVLSASIALLNVTRYDAKFSEMNRKIRSAFGLADSALTDLFRQYSQDPQGVMFNSVDLNRSNKFYQGNSSMKLTPNDVHHSITFKAIGTYGKGEYTHKKTVKGVIKFISEISRYLVMWKEDYWAMYYAGSTTDYKGSLRADGNGSIYSGYSLKMTGSGIVNIYGDMFVRKKLYVDGITLNVYGNLYIGGTVDGPINVTGTRYSYYPDFTWPTVNWNYFKDHANANLKTDLPSGTPHLTFLDNGTVELRNGTYSGSPVKTYAIPQVLSDPVLGPKGFIVYAEGQKVRMKGAVHGRVTVASNHTSICSGCLKGDVQIDKGIRYANAASTNLASAQDSLFVFTKNNIVFQKEAGTDYYVSGAFFKEDAATKIDGNSLSDLHMFGTRNSGLNSVISGDDEKYIFDPYLQSFPSPGTPEKPVLVSYLYK